MLDPMNYIPIKTKFYGADVHRLVQPKWNTTQQIRSVIDPQLSVLVFDSDNYLVEGQKLLILYGQVLSMRQGPFKSRKRNG